MKTTNHKSMSVKNLMLIPTALLLVVSCAKDQTAQEYQDQVKAHDLAQYQAVAGTYTGTAVQSGTATSASLSSSPTEAGVVLGAVSLTLDAELITGTTTTDGSAAAQQPVITAQFNFLGNKSAQITFNSKTSTLDPQTGNFNADTTLNADGSTSSTSPSSTTTTVTTGIPVKLAGGIANGHFSGSIYVEGYTSQKLLLELDLNGPSTTQIKASSKPFPNVNGSQFMYAGHVPIPGAVNANSTDPNVTMVVTRTDVSDALDFIGLIYPVHPVSVQMDFGDGATFVLTNTRLDWSAGTMVFPLTMLTMGTGGASFGTLGLSCSEQGTAWNCNLLSSDGTSSLSGTFLPVTTLPPLPGVSENAFSYSYQGTVTDPAGEDSPVSLKVDQPAETGLAALQDILTNLNTKKVIALITFAPPAKSTLAFANAEVDPNSQGLSAQQQITNNGTTANFTLNCHNYVFTAKPTHDFDCDLLAPTGVFTLKFSEHAIVTPAPQPHPHHGK